jgi:trans-2-enoyl-CoA reductase
MAATRILTPRALGRACAAQSPFTALASQGPRAAQAIRNAQASQVTQLTARRWKSGPFGYTQAKALVYSTYGEPKDVLS